MFQERIEWRNWKLLLVVTLLCLLFCSILLGGTMIRGKAAGEQMVKCYTCIRISGGDSLWKIARLYMGEGYDDIQEYIEEVKELNQLTSDQIHAGQYLTLPYYSSP